VVDIHTFCEKYKGREENQGLCQAKSQDRRQEQKLRLFTNVNIPSEKAASSIPEETTGK